MPKYLSKIVNSKVMSIPDILGLDRKKNTAARHLKQQLLLNQNPEKN